MFQPILPEVISGSIGILDTITPIRRLCQGTNLFTRTIESIDLKRRRIGPAAGFGSRQCYLDYDHLVITLGNVTNLAGQPWAVRVRAPLQESRGRAERAQPHHQRPGGGRHRA